MGWSLGQMVEQDALSLGVSFLAKQLQIVCWVFAPADKAVGISESRARLSSYISVKLLYCITVYQIRI
jgi:hypothetical protein